MDGLVSRGQRLARAGLRVEARRTFLAALAADPWDKEAWLWRAGTADTPEETLECLEQVLRLEPGHPRALRGVAAVRAQIARSRDDQPAGTGRGQPAASGRTGRSRPAAVRQAFWSLILSVSLGLTSLPSVAAPGPMAALSPTTETASVADTPIPSAVPAESALVRQEESSPPEDLTVHPVDRADSPPSELATSEPEPMTSIDPAETSIVAAAAALGAVSARGEALHRPVATSTPSTASSPVRQADGGGGADPPIKEPGQPGTILPPETPAPSAAADLGRAQIPGPAENRPASGPDGDAPTTRPPAVAEPREADAPARPNGPTEGGSFASLLVLGEAITGGEKAAEPTEPAPPRDRTERPDQPEPTSILPAAAPATPPQELARAATAKPPLVLRRLRQRDPEQYPNMSTQDFRAWAEVACGAASFATLVNAVDPERKMTVGQAVELLQARDLISRRLGLLRREDFGDVARALNEVAGRGDAAYTVNLRDPQQVRAHFEAGGGPIMFTGPSTAVWGVPHIYVATAATNGGLQILDSSQVGRTFLSWPEWQAQTGSPGEGAGVALRLAE